MINKYTYKDLVWVDLESPSREEVKKVMDQFRIEPLVAQELLTPSVRPKIEVHPDFIYFVLHIPAIKHSHAKATTHGVRIEQEIDFIVGRQYIVTTHYDSIDPLHKFSRIFEVNTILDKAALGKHAGFIFFYMFQRIYAGLMDELESIDDSLREIEEDIFNGKEKEMVIALSNTSRNLLDFKQSIAHHHEILKGLETVCEGFFGDGFEKYIVVLMNEYEKIHEKLRAQNDLLNELRSTNDSILTTKQNETMKTFTVMAFTTLPISLLISILSIQSPSNPILGQANDFWLIIGAAFISVTIMIGFFKYKKWL